MISDQRVMAGHHKGSDSLLLQCRGVAHTDWSIREPVEVGCSGEGLGKKAVADKIELRELGEEVVHQQELHL